MDAVQVPLPTHRSSASRRLPGQGQLRTGEVADEDGDLRTPLAEAHMESVQWLLTQLRDELRISDDLVTPIHLRVINDFIIGDEDLTVLFFYLKTVVATTSANGDASRSELGGGGLEGGNSAGSPRARRRTLQQRLRSIGSTANSVASEDEPLGPADEDEDETTESDDGAEISVAQSVGAREVESTEKVTELCISVGYPALTQRYLDPASNMTADVMYFVRVNLSSPVTPENVDASVVWGVSRGGTTLDTFLRCMQHIYTPSLLRSPWPDSIIKEIHTIIHRSMAVLTENINRLKGSTVLYVPSLYAMAPEEISSAHQDRELVQRYETAAIHWTRQIKEVVLEKDVDMAAGCGPLDEIAYWRARATDLNNIRKQLNRLEVAQIVNVLREAKSFYFLDPFLNLRSDIEKGTEEAFDNLRYLNVLVQPCTNLAQAEPKDIAKMIPEILSYAQLILIYSSNYRKERLARLLRMISNEIINRCSRKIDINAVFAGDVGASVVALYESIHAGEVWIRECRAMLEATHRRFKMEKGERLELDDTFLNEIDGFVRHRCHNLLEICKGQMQFGFKGSSRRAESSVIGRSGSVGPRGDGSSLQASIFMSLSTEDDKRAAVRCPLYVPELDGNVKSISNAAYAKKLPRFGGPKGPDIENQLLQLQRAFKSKMESLRRLDYNILDVKATRWVDDFRALKADMDSLGVMMRQVIAAAFDGVATVETGAEYIEAFFLISKNGELLQQLDRSTERVLSLFVTAMKSIQLDVQRYYNTPPPLFYLHPPFAGEASWAMSRVKQLAHDRQYLRRCYYLPDSTESTEAFQFYHKLNGTLEETVWRQYRSWKEGLPATPSEYLDHFLIVKSPNDDKGPAMFEVNFSEELLLLFEEVRYWSQLGEAIPPHIAEICTKEERLRVFRENVAIAVRGYNQVVESLTRDEYRLLEARVSFLEARYQPGLSKLWWNSQGIIEYFVVECCNQASYLQQMVDDFKYGMASIEHHCGVIANTVAVHFEKKKVYTVDAFDVRQKEHRALVEKKLRTIHGIIIDRLCRSFEMLRNDYAEKESIRMEWHRLVESVEHDFEKALKTMVKRSLVEIEKSLPAESDEEHAEEKVFHIDVVINTSQMCADGKPTIETVPSVTELAHRINQIGKEVISLVKSVPRVEASLAARIGHESAEELEAKKWLPVTYDGQARESVTLSGSYYDYLAGEEDIILVLQSIREAFGKVDVRVREKLQQTWLLHQSGATDNLWATQKQDRRIKQGWRLEDYRINMDHVSQRKDGIDRQQMFANVLFLLLDFTKMKDTFRAQCTMVIKRYHNLLYVEAKEELDFIYNQFSRVITNLTREPSTLDQLGDQIMQCAAAEQELPKVESKFTPIMDKFSLLTNSAYNSGDVDEANVRRCEELPTALETYKERLVGAKKLLEKYKDQFKHDLEIDLRAFRSNCIDVQHDVKENGPFSFHLSTAEAFATIHGFSKRAADLRTRLANLQQGIEIFRLEQPGMEELVAAEGEIEMLTKIWTLCERWRTETGLWKTQYFMTLDSEVMMDTIEDVQKSVLRMRKEMEHRDVWVKLREDVESMKRMLPIIEDLLTKAIRPRHWEQLKVQLDNTFNIQEEGFCLELLLGMQLDTHAEFIANLATAAREEMKIEGDMEKIGEFWSSCNLTIEPYQSYHKITSIDDINNALAEHMALLSSMKMSRFVDNFRSRVMQWEQSLSVVTDTLDTLLTVQTKWMYLESIFLGSEDIKRKLVAESKRFDLIHTQWLGIIARLMTDPNVLRGTRREGLLDHLNSMDGDLEMIQKSLEGFLEDRRRAFPRFYFLSNDDLLEILGHTKEPEKVQPHLRKCFEGLFNLSFKKIRQRTVADAMISADGENVPFSPLVQIEGLQVEVWLTRAEEKMRETVQNSINRTLLDLQQNVYSARRPINRDQLKEWVERNEGQSLITAACINWTREAERAIAEYGEMGGLGRRKESPLYKLYKKWKSLIKKYCYMVRQPQDKFQRNKLVALITIEVHSRDILRQLQVSRVHSLDDFEWSRQLRFYAEPDSATENGEAAQPPPRQNVCFVRQASATVRYDYEYLGNSGRLVVTGLTDRAYMTLTTALQLHRGGLPQGPAGTGKTETVKDLGKAIAKYVMVFNCSDGLDYRSIGRMLSGIAQTGAWSCFDEFNRIEVEVLSVVAQQILSILTAATEMRRTFLFEGSEIPLNNTCGLFVTMNPGYAGRSELPDNLKALLRPISMMVPDFTLICEITLLSQGFEESEVLSKKVSILYELMEKQLSKQDHYDFSLRNIKAVLVQAGNLKRENFPGTESQLCLKAMIDMNLPKFVKEDVPLFLGMLGDLFPGIKPEDGGLGELRAASLEDLVAEGLEGTEQILVKVLHLWDTLRTRHGVMVVGQTGSGKTVTWKTLTGGLRRLKESGTPGPFEPVRVSLLNPKSVTMDELYGSYNQATREWKDGILSDLMRQMCRDVSDPNYKWLLFDGPVDTLWIESMNTVLDDNKMLTLNSGERINMNPTVSMLFEVQDLSQASPATVSRCGMVYFNVEDLGWQPLFNTWLRSRRQFEVVINAPKPDATIEELRNYVTETMPRVLSYRRTECTELFPTTDISAVRAFTRIFDAIANPNAAPCIPGGSPYLTSQAGENYLAQVRLVATFSLLWAVGGTLTVETRPKFDSLIRELDSSFPSTETVFEYYPDVRTMRWRSWDDHPDLQKPFLPPSGTPYFRQIVPTVDTVRYKYIVGQLVRNQVQLVLVGTTGTGKSLIATQVAQSFPVETHVTAVLNFSAQTTAKNVQDIIEGRMEHKSKKVCGPPGGRRMICFVEDLNMPAKEVFGAQPPLELLRQWLDNGYWYDRATRSRRQVNDMQLMCCMTYGRPDITQRLLSKLVLFNVTFPADAVVTKIFTAILTNRFSATPDLLQYTDVLVKATVQVYKKVTEDLLPIPSKSHYLFNLRDLSKVFQGIFQCHLPSIECKEHVVALWVHECYRVFADRMNDLDDKAWFRELISEKLATIFQTKWSNMLAARKKELRSQQVGEKEGPIFVDFWDGEFDEMAKYKLVPSLEALKAKAEESLESHNSEPGSRAMNLVFFTDALEHLCRIHRIIRQPRGNALLVGLGGSGRNSLTRLAAYLAGYSLFSIEIHKKYDSDRFHEDLRTLYKACGVKRQQKVFYFSDNQIMHTSFLEDLNNMLSSGEVPNLFPKDELSQIRDEIFKAATAAGCRDTPDEIYNYFIDCARQNLHLVVAMSPAHKQFRSRLRQFPALVSCTSIDWFIEWPNDALKEVGVRYLQDTRESEEEDEFLHTVADMFVYMHDTTNQESRRLQEQLRRYNYVTPSSYLDLVRGYRKMYAQKHEEIIEQRDKLSNGMSKLEETKVAVGKMKEELKIQDERLQVKSAEVEKATEEIQVQQLVAEEQQALLGTEKAKIEQTKRAALADQLEAQTDLDRAMPTLLEAQAALDKLDKSDINEIKSYKTPAAMIRTVMEAVQVALHRKLDWDEAKRSLNDSKFIDTLKQYHENNDMTDQKLLNSLEKYVKRPDFTPAAASAVSKAAGGLCQWVIAIHKYGNIFKEVHPKMLKNENAQQKVRAQEEMLRQKEERLATVMAELQQLQEALKANVDEKNRLLAEAKETQDKLNRAQIIVEGLEGERDRWTQSIVHYNGAIGNLTGDTMITCAFLCYAGAFPADFRQVLLSTWTREVRRLQLPLTKNIDVVDFLVDPTEVRDWQQVGLPGDDFSRENGAIVTRGSRWPLMIDPQQQALRWIKKMERDNGLKIIDQKQADFQKTVEYAVQFGCPLLLQDILEEIDPLLDTVVSKAIVRRGSRSMVKIGDNYVEYNENFKLYITTRLANPHYTPETCTKVCLLNFSVKEQGLEEQLLKIVVEMEKPELEEENEQLILDTAAAKKETKRLEDEILDLLSTSQVSLLENIKLIETLQSSKTTAANIQRQLREAEETAAKIQSAREEYRVCAQRASTLFFVLADLEAIDSMYQFALDSQIALFRSSIKRSAEKIISRTLAERVTTLVDWHTNAVYSTTCRGLFEKDKLLFAFHMAMRILKARGQVNLEEYVFFIKGAQMMDKQGRLPNPAPSWLSERSWDHILELDKLTNFHGIAASFEQSPESWRHWFLQERPEEADLPGEWQAKTEDNHLQRMILARCLRPDRVVFMVYRFIEASLGPQYVEPPAFNLKDTFDESRNTIPLIFVLSPGVDPTSQLAALAQREGKKLRSLALGQGQGGNAKRAIQECSQTGGWVFLANCHLMVSWLTELEKIIEDLPEQHPHDGFRLWLSSTPTPRFPIGVLQRSIKMTTEPPSGIKSNMLRLYSNISEEQFEEGSSIHPHVYRSLLFGLCFFHSILLERRKYGTLGYNVMYDFTYSDFEVSESILQLYIGNMESDAIENIPFKTIRYLIAEASYGGRVTDDWDRRVLNTYIQQYMRDATISEEQYMLSSSDAYYIPANCSTLQGYRDECMKLPLTDPPEAFGQHANADISSRIAESTNLLDNLISVNANLARGGGNATSSAGASAGKAVTLEDRCLEILASIEEPSKAAIPQLIDFDAIYEATNEDRNSALNTCLLQEIQRYNALLRKVHRQKAELRRAVKGEIIMGEDLESIFNSLLIGRVPVPWTSAYPSTKPLASWSVDLVDRVEQMKLWGQRTPNVFWLAGFTYPTGFLKSLQQQQARLDQISIDQYGWEFVVLPSEERTIVSRTKKGAFVRGIYLEGAGWDGESNALCEPKPMELIVNMPIIHFKPTLRDGRPKPTNVYECPLYMYPIRTGTRERPSYVVTVDLQTKHALPEHYTKRGTALLLSTND